MSKCVICAERQAPQGFTVCELCAVGDSLQTTDEASRQVCLEIALDFTKEELAWFRAVLAQPLLRANGKERKIDTERRLDMQLFIKEELLRNKYYS